MLEKALGELLYYSEELSGSPDSCGAVPSPAANFLKEGACFLAGDKMDLMDEMDRMVGIVWIGKGGR